jgi:hypothetical protein
MKCTSFIIYFSLALFLFLFFSVSGHTKDTERFGKINKDQINIRSDSTINAPSLGNLRKEEIVPILGEKYEWYKIGLPARFVCYLSASFATKTEKNTVTVSVDVLNLRQSPSLSSPIIGRVTKDQFFTPLGEDAQWYKVNCLNNCFGWVLKQFVTITDMNTKEYLALQEKELSAGPKNNTSSLPDESPQVLPPNIFAAQGILLRLSPFKNCLANYKLQLSNNYAALFLKISPLLDVTTLVGKTVAVRGKRIQGNCSYLDIDSIKCIDCQE